MPESNKSSSRSAGLLLHPTSLPGPYGIGDLGPAAYAWIDTLVQAKQKWWQILPLGPTGYGDSPYQSFSAFAGNPNLVSPELLVNDGLLDRADIADGRPSQQHVDFGAVISFKNQVLEKAWQLFQAGRGAKLQSEFADFCLDHAGWLDDYALFMALKEAQATPSWLDWPADLRRREGAAIEGPRRDLAELFGSQRFRQFLFFRQWRGLKNYAGERGIGIIGDMPIFVSIDSADVWSHPELFFLDRECRPTVVAGVPPDYFSATGQLWGNPLYNWNKLAATGFSWWIERLQKTLELVDVVRLDHFRGFEAYWEVPAGAPNAINGRWIKAPGTALLEALNKALGGLPLIAEDLGLITPQVEALRDAFGLPGMRVLQFAFGDDAKNPYLPHNYLSRTVAYTGTHDNDTTRGWYAALPDNDKDHVRRYLGRDGSDIAWDLIRAAWSSVADLAIAPLQDVLNLGSAARMNSPGNSTGNWGWRFADEQWTTQIRDRLAQITALYGR
ncbi:MAG: 4-alpha-glucanotransferase [Gemmataceae bacterium]|nr:4-alpha-glucanotransferase [Gemmataceae bacterium]